MNAAVPVLAALIAIVVAAPLRPRPVRPGARPAGRRGLAGRLDGAATALVAATVARRERRAGLAPAIVGEWCGDLARSIRSGHTLRHALEHEAPANDPLRQATDPLRLGLSRGRTIAELTTGGEPRSRGDEHLALVYSVLTVCGRLGGSAAPPLDRVAATLRRRAADDQERVAQAAQARMSAHVLTLVPLAVLALLVAADDGVRAALTSPIGATCVVVGAILNLVGWFWMRRIVRSER